MDQLWQVIQNWDAEVFLWINGFANSKWDYLFGWPTHLGEGYLALILVFVLMRIWLCPEHFVKHFTYVLLSVFSIGIVSRILKWAVSRDRPYVFFYDAIDRGEATVHFLFKNPSASSFPSGHAAVVFLLAVILYSLYGKRMWFLFPLACWIALTRIYTGAHFPTDVLAGAGIGILTGWAAAKWLRGYFTERT